MNEEQLRLIKMLVKQLEADYRGYDEDGLRDDYSPEARAECIKDTKQQLLHVIELGY